MAIQIQGSGGTTADVAGTTFRALKIQTMPTDYGALGHYGVGLATGILPAGLAANSEIFQFRWADATRFALVRRFRISAAVSTTFFAAGVPVQIDLIKSTSWSVQGTLGTGVTMGTALKKRATMGSSLVGAGDMRIATTAALGAGTKTLEANSFAMAMAPGPVAAPGTIIAPGTVLWEADIGEGDHPFLLATNEGLSIRAVGVPALGTWQFTVQMSWAEISAF